ALRQRAARRAVAWTAAGRVEYTSSPWIRTPDFAGSAMRRTILRLGAAGLLPLTGLTGCGVRTMRTPQPGGPITPRLNEEVRWTAGQPGQLAVRLVARGKDGSNTRDLGFSGLPGDVNPVATVTFFKGDEAQSPPVSVTLDHRC